jgi:hypothetical protein
MAAKATIRVKVARNELRKIGKDEAGKRVARATRQLLNRARVLSPWDTGNLRGSHEISIRTLTGALKVVGRVTATAKYASYVHDGTRPHVIRPKAARRRPDGKPTALKFKMGGRTIIVSKVNHPGTRAQPWLATALYEVAARNNMKVVKE